MVKRRFLCSLLCCSPCCAVWRSWERIPDSWERMRCSPRSLPGFSGSLREISGSLLRYSDSLLRMPVSQWGFFRKPTSPPLPLREGPPLISVFSPQGRRGNRSSSSLVTISFYGWRTIRGLASSGAAIFCAGMNPLSLKDLLRGCLMMLRQHKTS